MYLRKKKVIFKYHLFRHCYNEYFKIKYIYDRMSINEKNKRKVILRKQFIIIRILVKA